MRIFFATDIHGSDVCWRKFLNAGKFHKADVLIMGGDMTGKAMVPIVANGSAWDLELQGQRQTLSSEDDLRAMEKRISDRGYYPVRLTRDEVDAWAGDPALVDARFKAEMLAAVERWMALADERMAGTGIRCIVSPANDDMFEIDPIIERAANVELGEGNTIDLDGFTLVSTGWANPTPWNTFRELPEPELRERIDGLVAAGSGSEAGDLQFPRAALWLEPGQRAETGCRHEHGVGRAGARAGRVARGPRVDLGLRSAVVAARPYPRGQGRGHARLHPGGQPRQFVRGRRSSRRRSSTSMRRRDR